MKNIQDIPLIICNISFSFTENIDIDEIKQKIYTTLLDSDILIEPDTLNIEFEEIYL